MAGPYFIKHIINKTFSQRFFWSRLSHIRGIGRLMEYALFEDDDIIYLPKDNTVPINQSLPQKEDLVVPSDVLIHFIKKAKYRWIMDFCICRDSSDCKDYPINLGCMFLGEAAKDINPRFGRLVSEQEALDHVTRCREAGLVHLIGRNKLDTVWLNIKPGEKLLTICNCCPCCCLWKVLPVINPSISSKVNRMPGVSVRVTEKCVGCGTCTKDICFVDAIHLDGEKAVIGEDCRGCGRCVSVCKKGAIELRVDNQAFVDDAINRISGLVDVS
ncbi:MAG: 4Fe-4S binding protein [Proteobacteria bacterium]|nr:4Fe-4S binding protein [Pseudomonadota bacterium]